MNIEDIESKENSQEKLDAIQGDPTKYYVFAEEFNALVHTMKKGIFVIKYNGTPPANAPIGSICYETIGGTANDDIWRTWMKTISGWVLIFKCGIIVYNLPRNFQVTAYSPERFAQFDQTQGITRMDTNSNFATSSAIVTSGSISRFMVAPQRLRLHNIDLSLNSGMTAFETSIFKSSNSQNLNQTLLYNQLKLNSANFDFNLPGHQLTNFENVVINAQEHLHIFIKISGMASNRWFYGTNIFFRQSIKITG